MMLCHGKRTGVLSPKEIYDKAQKCIRAADSNLTVKVRNFHYIPGCQDGPGDLRDIFSRGAEGCEQGWSSQV